MSAHLLVRTSKKTGIVTLYFKRRVPSELAPLIGKAVWRQTLRTSDRRQAEIEALRLDADAEEMIAQARVELRRQRGAVARLTPAERAVVERAGGLQALRTDTNETLGESRFAVAAFSALTAATKAKDDGTPVDDLEGELAGAEARVAFLRRQIERNRAILSRAGIKPDKDSQTTPPEEVATDLRTVLDRWARDTQAPAQHVEQYAYPVRRFYEVHGPIKLKEITKAHLLAFQDSMARLPRSTRANLRKESITRAIVIADRENLPRITQQTVAKHMTAVAHLLKLAMGWDWLDANPAVGFTVLQPRKKKSEKRQLRRLPLSSAQLRDLDASLAGEYAETQDDRWIPIVAAYSGMRLEEITQLAVDDVRQEDGIWIMAVTDAGEGQKVKTDASQRFVPIHPTLVARGFLDHVARSPGPRVFQSLKPDQRGRFGGPYGKRFARHLAKRAKITGRQFHGIRHHFEDAMRDAEMPDGFRDAVMGHANGSPISRIYGTGPALSKLAEWIAKVDPFADAVTAASFAPSSPSSPS